MEVEIGRFMLQLLANIGVIYIWNRNIVFISDMNDKNCGWKIRKNFIIDDNKIFIFKLFLLINDTKCGKKKGKTLLSMITKYWFSN